MLRTPEPHIGSRPETPEPDAPPERVVRIRRGMAVGVTTTALILIAVRLIWPHLSIDMITLVLLLAAALPWLGVVFSSVQLPGGWRVEYHQLAQRVERTERDVANVAHSARVALGAASTAPVRPPRTTKKVTTPTITTPTVTTPVDHSPVPARPQAETPIDIDLPAEVADLASEYARVIAAAQGPERTGVMDRIFGRLVAVTPREADFDPTLALRSQHPGIRLAGYAYLYAHPQRELLEVLVDVLTDREYAAFSQYWAIRAIALVVESEGPDALSATAAGKLMKFCRQLSPDSARAHTIVRLFRVFGLAGDTDTR